MQRVVFDTNVIIRYGPASISAGYYMSAVVIQELTAGAADGAEARDMDLTRRQFEADGKLLVPTGEDWWQAGKVLNSMWRGLKSHRVGRTSAISKEEQQRLLRDVLIARTAKRANAVLVTENLADYKKISRFCDVKAISPREFF